MGKNPVPDKGASNSTVFSKGNSKSTSDREAIIRWYKELVARLIQKSESIQKARQQIIRLIESKNILLSKLKEKNGEIHRLNEKISLLLRELSVSKKLHSKALNEIEMLKTEKEESTKKNEIIEQEKSFYNEVQRELPKSQSSLMKRKLKTNNVETSQKWQAMKYADPQYFGMLQKRSHLRKEFEKKMILKKNREMEFNRQSILLESFRDMLKRRPHCPSEKPPDQMMEFYKTIQLRKKESTTAETKYYD